LFKDLFFSLVFFNWAISTNFNSLQLISIHFNRIYQLQFTLPNFNSPPSKFYLTILINFKKIHQCQPTATHFNLLQPTSTKNTNLNPFQLSSINFALLSTLIYQWKEHAPNLRALWGERSYSPMSKYSELIFFLQNDKCLTTRHFLSVT